MKNSAEITPLDKQISHRILNIRTCNLPHALTLITSRYSKNGTAASYQYTKDQLHWYLFDKQKQTGCTFVESIKQSDVYIVNLFSFLSFDVPPVWPHACIQAFFFKKLHKCIQAFFFKKLHTCIQAFFYKKLLRWCHTHTCIQAFFCKKLFYNDAIRIHACRLSFIRNVKYTCRLSFIRNVIHTYRLD